MLEIKLSTHSVEWYKEKTSQIAEKRDQAITAAFLADQVVSKSQKERNVRLCEQRSNPTITRLFLSIRVPHYGMTIAEACYRLSYFRHELRKVSF